MKLTNIILPSPPTNASTYDIEISNHTITAISPHTDSHTSASHNEQAKCPPPSLLLPTLCHPHIHLDKPYLLTSNHNHPGAYPPCCPRPNLSLKQDQIQPPSDQSQAECHQDPTQQHSTSTTDLPSYAPLVPLLGTFPEALNLTSRAKHLYTTPDLYLRGAQLLATSYMQGVTSARCFAEVDHVTRHAALDVGLRLKREFEGNGKMGMRVQICVFAQDPIFAGGEGEENRRLIEGALERDALEHGKGTIGVGKEGKVGSGGEAKGKREEVQNDDHDQSRTETNRARELGRGIEVLGTTPYVESSRAASIRNIEWAITTALKYDIHLDFHLDYNLDPNVTREQERLLVWEVLRLLKRYKWPTRKSKKRNARGRRGGSVKTVVLGHSTALTLLSHASLLKLSTEIRESGLPIYFVGLPTSDVYMMGRPDTTLGEDTKASSDTKAGKSNASKGKESESEASKSDGSKSDTSKSEVSSDSALAASGSHATPLHRPRGTLNVMSLFRNYDLPGCLSVNNVGNAFTPFGTGDPLELASWGVGLFHAGGKGDAERLFGCISSGARRACGLEVQQEGNERQEGGNDYGGDSDDDGVDGSDDDEKERDDQSQKEEGEGLEGNGDDKDREERNGQIQKDKNDGDDQDHGAVEQVHSTVSDPFIINEGDSIADFGLLLIANEEFIGDPDKLGIKVPARRRVSVRDVVWDVPEVRLRSVIR